MWSVTVKPNDWAGCSKTFEYISQQMTVREPNDRGFEKPIYSSEHSETAKQDAAQ